MPMNYALAEAINFYLAHSRGLHGLADTYNFVKSA